MVTTDMVWLIAISPAPPDVKYHRSSRLHMVT